MTDKVIDTDDIRGAPVTTQESEPQPLPEFQEIDPALEKLASGTEAANYEHFDQPKEPGKAAAAVMPGKSYTASELENAEETALSILGAAFCAVQDFTGRSYGLTEKAAIKTAKGIAPCLAKYRITDTGEVFSKWGEEVQALLAVGALIAGVYRELKKDAANDGNKSEQRQSA